MTCPTPASFRGSKSAVRTAHRHFPLASDLGPGESAVLALALESADAAVILDDALARRVAASLQIPLTGTLGLLLDAKRRGLLPAVAPCLAPHTRAAVLLLAGEV